MKISFCSGQVICVYRICNIIILLIMYIQTLNKTSPPDIENLKNKKFDDFTEFKRRQYKQKKKDETQYVQQLVISSKEQIQSSDLLKSKKFAFSFKNSRARQLKMKKKEGSKDSIKGKLIDQLRNVIQKNAFKFNQAKSSAQKDFQKQVTIKGRSFYPTQRTHSKRYSSSYENEIYFQAKQSKKEDEHKSMSARKIQSSAQTRIKWNQDLNEEPKILNDYRRSMSDMRMRYRKNQRKHMQGLLQNGNNESEIRPWAIRRQDDDLCNFN